MSRLNDGTQILQLSWSPFCTATSKSNAFDYGINRGAKIDNVVSREGHNLRTRLTQTISGALRLPLHPSRIDPCARQITVIEGVNRAGGLLLTSWLERVDDHPTN